MANRPGLNRRFTLATAILFWVAMIMPVAAAVPVTGQVLVNTTVSGHQFSPAIAMNNATGDSVVVWSSQMPNGIEAIFLQRYNAAGLRVAGQVRVDDPNFLTFSNEKKRDAAVAMDNAGNVFVVWTGGGGTGDLYAVTWTVAKIYGQRFNAAGVAQGPNFMVNTFAWGHHETPSVAMFASGEAVVVWKQIGGPIFMQRFDATGARLGPLSCPNEMGLPQACDSPVNATTASRWNPRVAVNPSVCAPPPGGACQLGTVAVVWEEPTAVRAQLFDGGNGLRSGPEFSANTNPNHYPFGQPAVAMDANANLVVAWIGDSVVGSSFVHGIYAQRFGMGSAPCPTGCAVTFGPLGNQVQVADLIGGNNHFTRLSVGAATTGAFVVAWNDLVNGTSAEDAIWGRDYDASANPLGTRFQVNAVASTYYRPAVRMNPTGDFIVTFEGGNDGGGGPGVWLRRYAGATPATPPVITRTVTGTLGTNGWYTTDVGITWTVTSASPILVQTGCGSTSVITDTPGITLTCSATNAGGTTSGSVTIKRDATPPSASLAVTAGTLGNSGWYVSNVTVATTGTDTVSGPVSCTAPQALTSDTAGQAVNGSCTNMAGLSTNATPLNVKIDKTVPAIAITSPASGAEYERSAAIPSSYSCTDVLSGLASCTGTVASGTNIDTATLGVKTFSVNAADVAGNTTTQSVTYNVVCHYAKVVPPASTVARGGRVTLTAQVKACEPVSEILAVRLTVSGPPSSVGCIGLPPLTFTTPQFVLPPGTSLSLPLPVFIPPLVCPGTYSVRADILRGGLVIDTSTARITVTP
jgi:hypothetical protein